MASSPVDTEMIVAMRDAVEECTDRGLLVAAKWVSEMLLAVPQEKRRLAPAVATDSVDHDLGSDRSITPRPPNPIAMNAPASSQFRSGSSTPVAPSRSLQPADVRRRDLELEAEESALISSARAIMEQKEFGRVVHRLDACKSQKAIFLKLYSEYLYSEKKALREWYKLNNTRHQPPLPVNTSLARLLPQVQNATDPWLLFLKALFLFRLSRRGDAIEVAMQSIATYPWNWAAWSILGECIDDHQELDDLLPRLPLPATNILVKMFRLRLRNLLHSPDTHDFEAWEELLSEDFFPGSLWIMSQRARGLYHSFEYEKSKEQFVRIFELDPYRIDDVDIYANVLYVLEDTSTLAELAHNFLALDKDRPEVCSLLGNYHSIRREHEKAVKYYRRATHLDRTYLAAWTLMGHEFIELKNPHAAIEAYRKAVDANKKDYRAWFGLGQSYSMLNMHTYALYYFQHSTLLRPYDGRIWQAQASCFEETGRFKEAILCLERALVTHDPQDTQILLRLARLNNDIGIIDRAIHYHRKVAETTRRFRKPIADAAKSAVYVARYYLMQRGLAPAELELAMELLKPVAESTAEEAGQAKELVKKIRLLLLEFAASSAHVESWGLGRR